MPHRATHDRYLRMLETAFGQTMMDLMEDDDVIEIMLNPDGHLIVDRLSCGKKITDIQISPDLSENLIKLVASYKNAVVNAHEPSIAADLVFKGARFQGWLPPVVSQPTFAIRKRATRIFTLDEYVKENSLIEKGADILREAIRNHKNIMIAGGTSSGKTTFANAVLHELQGTHDRLIILEDLPELQVAVEDVVFMTTTAAISMRDLVRGSMRMRPDRLMIGEVRDGAALDLLKAWNTGHPGGICTIHANSVESTLLRLEDLIREVVVTIPKNLILEAIDLIVYIKKEKSGKRVIQNIAELAEYSQEKYVLRQLV